MKKLITILILAVLVSSFAQTGIGTTTPNANAQLDVTATNKGFLPPRLALTSTTSASPLAAHVAGMVVYNTATAGDVTPGLYVNNGTAWVKQGGVPNGTVAGQMYYWNGTDWVNVSPGITGETLSYCNGVPTWGGCALVAIGDSYLGGKVAYILQSGDAGYDANVQHGLIAATADYGTKIPWSKGTYPTYTTTGATGTVLGTGSTNTTTIIANQQNTGIYAAKICRDYTGGGFNDWYLPSLDELNKLHLNQIAIGGFFNDNYGYWSSSEAGNLVALSELFVGSGSSQTLKSLVGHVRAVRTF